jgi:hypothetical protein
MKKIICFMIFLLVAVHCGRPTVSETASFEIVSVCSLPGYAEDIDIADNLAYIADDQGGLQIVNITNPESTSIVGQYLSEKSIVGVSVRDTFAYCAVEHKDGGVRIINIADPTAPFFVGEDNWYYGYGVMAPQEDTILVYVAGGYWFVVEDVRDPRYPTYVRRFDYAGDFRGVYVVDTIAYLACEQMGIVAYNLASTDTLPIGQVDTPSNARNIHIGGDYAYVADGRAGLIIVDISDPRTPFIVSRYDTPDYANDVFVSGNYAYVADGEGGLQVITIEDPEDPTLYGSIETSYADAVYVKDSLIFVADRDMGLVVITELRKKE